MKQIIVLRKDLNMSPGKAAAQACHASLSAFLRVQKHKKQDCEQWLEEGQTKVIVQVPDEETLTKLFDELVGSKLSYSTSLIRDAGHTELKGQNLTVLGIGPVEDEKIDVYTRKLLLYK